jgi:hypothetical protein
MEAKELRIGNFYKENGKVFITKIDDLLNLVRHEGTKYKSDMEGVKLTSMWLIGFDFVPKIKLGGFKGWYKKGFLIKGKENYYDFTPEGSSLVLCSIKYVHELQNIYFALQREELELKSISIQSV